MTAMPRPGTASAFIHCASDSWSGVLSASFSNLGGSSTEGEFWAYAEISGDSVISVEGRRFAKPRDRGECLKNHGLKGDRPVVLQLAGGFGVGNAPEGFANALVERVLPAADPAALRAGRQPSPELIESIRQQFGLDDPVMVQLCMGVPWGAPPDINTFMAMVNNVPADWTWSAFSLGRDQMPYVAAAVLAGVGRAPVVHAGEHRVELGLVRLDRDVHRVPARLKLQHLLRGPRQVRRGQHTEHEKGGSGAPGPHSPPPLIPVAPRAPRPSCGRSGARPRGSRPG